MSTMIEQEPPAAQEPVIGLAVVPEPPDATQAEHDASTDGQPPQQPPVVGRVAYGPRRDRPKRRRWLRVILILVMAVFYGLLSWLVDRDRTGEAW